VIADPELLWRFNPGVQCGFGVRINEHGYRTRPFTLTKEPGTMRVMVMGDSCTAQGEPPYSDRLHELLQQRRPPQPWEAFNTGVFGYSIEQGYRQFMKEVRHFQPDVVTIYFGWNDHWLNDRPDRLRLATRLSPTQAALARAIQNKRLFSVLTRRLSRPEPATATSDKVFRVPVEDYADTMTRLVEAIRATGAQPLILTAPRRSLTPSVVRSGHASAEAVAEQAHDHYMERTRELAARLDVPLLDLAREFAGPECDAYFSKDGIHFEKSGLHAIAQRLHAKLTELAQSGRLPPAPPTSDR
jgi:lysophospholipase L1-like esterase